MSKNAALVAVAALALALPVQAQRGVRLEITPVAGAAVLLSELPASFQLEGRDGDVVRLARVGLNDAPIIGGHLNLWLTPRLAVEASGTFVPTKLHGYGGSVSVDVSTFTLGGRLLSGVQFGRLQPFVSVGVGTKRYDLQGDVAAGVAHFAWTVGAGALSRLSEEVRFRIEARDCISVFASETADPSRVQHDLLLSIGLDLALIQRGQASRR